MFRFRRQIDVIFLKFYRDFLLCVVILGIAGAIRQPCERFGMEILKNMAMRRIRAASNPAAVAAGHRIERLRAPQALQAGWRRSRSCAAQCRVAGQFQIIQHHARHAVQPEHLFAHRFISFLLAFQHSNCKPSQTRHVLGPVTGADATAILIEIPVQHVMHRLDAPVPAIVLEQLLGIGLFGAQARDAVGVFPPAFVTTVFVFDNPLDHERLADMRELKIPVELRGHPDPAGLDAPVLKVDLLIIRLPARLKPQPYIVQQGRLIFFRREVVVCATSDQVFGKRPLCMQRIGSDRATGDIERIEHRRHSLDLIRALLLIASIHRQRADFF